MGGSINNNDNSLIDDDNQGIPPHESVSGELNKIPAPITPEQVNENEPPIEEPVITKTTPVNQEPIPVNKPEIKEVVVPDKKESENNGNILFFILGGITALMFGTK